MSSIKFFKVNSLPAVLEPNSIYFVNTAGILTVHVSDKDGVSSISLLEGINGNTFPYLVRKESPKVVGDTSGTALTTLGVNTRRMYFIPFISPRDIILTNVRVRVTGGSSGNILLGIYDNTKLANVHDVDATQVLILIVPVGHVVSRVNIAHVLTLFLSNK